MAILQSQETELRYLKRKNLDQESKIIGNYYRDIIRSYGIDCHYYKLDTTEFENFTNIVDKNVILKQAYGYNIMPDYHISVDMLTYMEVENDIFQLQKYGMNPNMDVNFYFDVNDFACALAIRTGQYKEYPIDEKEISIELTEDDLKSPIKIDETYTCDILTGKLSTEIENVELDSTDTVLCHGYEHTDFKVEFPVNKYIYKSFKHLIKNDEYLNSNIVLTYTITEFEVDGSVMYNLKGKISGSLLFYDIYKIGKYMDKIHPDVGDIITIDFPDESNREQYEITNCYDKQLTQDGISPLLHNYVWKCKARRYISAQENAIPEINEANERMAEKQRYTNVVQDEVSEHISFYPNKEDAVYGGYDAVEDLPYDKEIPNPYEKGEFVELDGMTALDIHIFKSGSKLITDGYDLYFSNSNGDNYKLTLSDDKNVPMAYFDSNSRFLKATDECVVFINIEGTAFKIAEDRAVTKNELQICLNSFFDVTMDPTDINKDNSTFYLFKGSKTLMWADENHLYCKLNSNKKLYQLI